MSCGFKRRKTPLRVDRMAIWFCWNLILGRKSLGILYTMKVRAKEGLGFKIYWCLISMLSLGQKFETLSLGHPKKSSTTYTKDFCEKKLCCQIWRIFFIPSEIAIFGQLGSSECQNIARLLTFSTFSSNP